MIVSVLTHALVMAVLHYLISDEWDKENLKGKYPKIVYQCIVNGICNIYLHNRIKDITPSYVHTMENKTRTTVFRQCLFDTIFVIENLVILILSNLKYPKYLGVGLVTGIFIAHCVGIGLKCVYYYQFHIWSNVLTFDKSIQDIKVSTCRILVRIRTCKTEDRVLSVDSNQVRQAEMMKMRANGIPGCKTPQITDSPESAIKHHVSGYRKRDNRNN